MKKLIGYVRVSSEVSKLKGNSISNQINKCKEYCKMNNYEITHILKDEGKSGMSYSKRDGYLELIEKCKNEDVDGVVVYSLSRLGRKMRDIIEVMELFNKNDIKLKPHNSNNSIIDLNVIKKISTELLTLNKQIKNMNNILCLTIQTHMQLLHYRVHCLVEELFHA